MISADRINRLQLANALLLLCFLTGCGPAKVIVQGNFPAPLMEPLPLKIGVWYDDDLARHEFFDEASEPGESSWVVNTGTAQVQMWDKLLAGVFAQVVPLKSRPGSAAQNPEVDAVLIPHVDELQYTIPRHTQVNVYEIWMRYRFELVTPSGESIAQWFMTSYGKTPTAFLQGGEAAVNLAAVMALRDAGANFAANFTRVPAVQAWLQDRGVLSKEKNP